MAGGLIAQTVARRERVVVALVTNGDATCQRDGAVREAETMTAMRALGVRDVRFLGYPDGALSALGETPLAPRRHRWPDGGCGELAETWADRRLGLVDEHTRRTGAPARWTASELEGDLTALLAEVSPRQVVISHGSDEHPDHASTYVFFRRALDRLEHGPAEVRRALVHLGQTWPQTSPSVVTEPTPPLPPPLEAYRPTERLAIDGAAKLGVIGLYPSQLDEPLPTDWLAGFARADEVFFTERLVRKGSRWVQAGSSDGEVRVLPLETGLEEVNEWASGRFSAARVQRASSRSATP